ncbi:MAG TPA: polysaccharide deacetylase family protein [Thermomicrobiales bacterium]|nr:polysaccharide deacetylase family protein [Thermomicrobiales bacterium]
MGEPRTRPESLGLVLLGLVAAIGLTLAIAVAFPAWNDLRQPDDPTANPTNGVAIADGTGAAATVPGPVAPRSPVPTRVRPTATTAVGIGEDEEDEETPAEEEPTRTPVAAPDATLRPAPPAFALDGTGISTVREEGPTYRQEVALTFDISPGTPPDLVEDTLDALDEGGVIGSFAIAGDWAGDNPDLVGRIIGGGHMVLNAGIDGESFTEDVTDSDDRIAQLGEAERMIEEIAGYDPRPFWRPPGGDTDVPVQTDAATAGYGVTVLWSVESGGAEDGADPDAVAGEVVGAIEPGSIVRFNLVEGSVDAEALPTIIEGLAAEQYAFVTIEQMLRP